MTPHLFPWANKSNTIGNGMLDMILNSRVLSLPAMLYSISSLSGFCWFGNSALLQFLLDRIKFIFKNCLLDTLDIQAFDHSSYNQFSV